MQGINGMGLSARAGQVGVYQTADSVTKTIQKQIQDLKKQLKEVSADPNMNAEVKARKQQDIQQQITDLQNQLRQHQMDQRQQKLKEKTEEAKSSEQAGMEAVVSADNAVRNAEVQEGVASKMKGRASVLRSEMELDAGRNSGTIPSKMNELARAEQASENARTTQMELLGDASQELQGVNEAEQDPEKKTEEAREEEEAKARQEEAEQAEALMYTSDGKTVSEEQEPRITVRA